MMSLYESRITRRQFTHTLAASAATSGFATDVATAGANDFTLNYILGSPMYGTTPLDRVVSQVRAVGAAAIDIWPRSHANHREQMYELGFDKVDQLLAEHDVQLGMITRYDLGPYRVTEEIETLKRFGGRLLVCGAKQQPGDTTKERVRNFVKSMKPFTDQAERHSVTIGIENHGNSLLSTPDSIKYFAQFVESPNLGLAMAPYHLPQDPSVIADLIHALGSHLVFFQAWQHGHGCMKKLPKVEELLQLPGRGDLDFRPILSSLRQINYQGWTEIFMHPVPRGIPILDSVRAVTGEINQSRKYLQQCLLTV